MESCLGSYIELGWFQFFNFSILLGGGGRGVFHYTKDSNNFGVKKDPKP